MDHVVVRAKVVRDNTGIAAELPVIVTDHGALEPLVAYLVENVHAKSHSWAQKLVQAVGLLLDYMAANHDCFADPKDLFRTFVQRLYSGTIGEDGLDPSGLYWLPRTSATIRQLTSQLSEFSDWMTRDEDGTAKPLNPWREATRFEEMLNWAAYHQRHSRAFLAHTWDHGVASEVAKRARNTLLKRGPKVERTGVKHFSDERFLDLLFKGFIVPGKQKSPRIAERLNLRDILITLLQHCGGLRASEPFHLYVHDVLPDPYDPDLAMVRVYHPSEGQAPDDWLDAQGRPKRCNREAYLRGKYQLRPRDNYYKTDPLHAGWKDPLLDSSSGKFMHVHWFPRWAGKLFKLLWDRYLIQRALLECHHPFAFVSLSGSPYAVRRYNQAHARAVTRIGLVPAKMNGTTPHGHRHAYGQRMTEAAIDPIIRKKAMHHKSIESQIAYTEPSIDRVTAMLSQTTDALDKGRTLPPPDFLQHGFEDVDPFGLFSGPQPSLR
jgi:integrase